jgi:hypothetical protein
MREASGVAIEVDEVNFHRRSPSAFRSGSFSVVRLLLVSLPGA